MLTFKLGLLFAALCLPVLSWGQATSSLLIPLNNQTFQSLGGQAAQVDILKEVKKLKPALGSSNIEIQMLRIEAKANIGGAQVFLKINNAMVADAVIDTNPEAFNSSDLRSFERFELKNIDRARISSASLQIRDMTAIKFKSIEVILGAVQEPTIFGKYADDQASQIGGVITDTRTSQKAADTVAANYFNFQSVPAANPQARTGAKPVVSAIPKPKPVAPVTKPRSAVSKPVVQPTPPRRPVAPPPQQRQQPRYVERSEPRGCIREYTGELICVGDIVISRNGFEQEVVAVNARSRNILLYCPDIADEPYSVHVDRL